MHRGGRRAASHIELPSLVTLGPLLSQSVPGPTCVLTAHTFSDFIPFLLSARYTTSTAKLTDKASPRLCWFPSYEFTRGPSEKDPESCILFMRAFLELATSSSVGPEHKSISMTGIRFKESGDQGGAKKRTCRFLSWSGPSCVGKRA